MTTDPESLGPIVQRHRSVRAVLLMLGLGGLSALLGGGVFAFGVHAHWGRAAILGGMGLLVGLLLASFAVRARNDALEVRRRGFVRISSILGTRVVAFDQIEKIEAIHARTFPGNLPREAVASVRLTTRDDVLVTLEHGDPDALLKLLARETRVVPVHVR